MTCCADDGVGELTVAHPRLIRPTTNRTALSDVNNKQSTARWPPTGAAEAEAGELQTFGV